MTEAQRPLLLIPYMVIWILITWAMMRTARRNGGTKEGDSFIAALIAFFWPIGLAVLVISAPFLAVGWLASKLPDATKR